MSHPTSGGTGELTFSPPANSAFNTILEDERADETSKGYSTSPPSPVIGKRPRANTGRSSISRVDIGYFDPDGVNELRRSLSRSSQPTQALADYKDEKSNVALETIEEAPFDFEKVLQDVVKKRVDANHKSRELGVMWKNLSVSGLGASASYQSTLGSLLNPFNKMELVNSIRHPPVRNILTGFEGVVRPGEMMLVLGSPGSGCSTLLKVLANQRDEYHGVKGDVHYHSLTPEQVKNHYRGDVCYCPEDDIHFPTLTVEQTLKFAATTRAPHQRLENSTREDYVNGMTNVISTIFGLNHVRNTPVGDAAIRGVSGGEKKRVSIGEMMASRTLVGAWDNSTRGLDASTALEFVRALRIATDVARFATIVSIYQASESLYALFDKVCVIDQGRMVYCGSAKEARGYFEGMGWAPKDRQTTPDFLVSCTDPSGRTPKEALKSTPIPRTAAEFADYFTKSPLGQANRDDVASYAEEFIGNEATAAKYLESVQAEHAEHTRGGSPYIISVPMQVRAVIGRRARILWGSMGAQIIQIASSLIQAVIMGTVFLRVPEATSAYFSRGGILFFALLLSALSAMAEIPALFAQRPIVLRHQKAAMYHPFIEAVALTLVDIPITFLTLIVFSAILYEAVKLQQTASQFFIFFLIVFTVTLTMKAYFRGLAAAFKSQATAQAVAGISVLVLVIYTGYAIPKPSMIGALRWITYINPLYYAFEAILSNEFHTLDGVCSNLVPSYPGASLNNQVCSTVGSIQGQSTVNGNTFIQLSYGYSYGHLWRNVGIVIAFGAAFIFALLVFTELNVASAAETAVVLFKRGSKTAAGAAQDPVDEEKTISGSILAGTSAADDKDEAQKALTETTPMTDVFSWQHLQYTVPVGNGETRKLLDDVSGYVAPGKLTALMGESGAGKTTLLNVLAQRVTSGVVTGDRLVNGQALPADFQAQTGYVQQMDTHVPTTTVREALLFSAKLRQPSSVSLADKEAYVETCLKLCGLDRYADAMVGSLDIEFRKRTTIGVELAAKPKLLLFLDEPTSGLDSQSAWAIMEFLRNLAASGQAILCTIHQPSAELFQVFDRLLLLRKGGKTVYFGDLGPNSTTLIDYFERNGSRACSPDENPAEFMLDVIGAGATASSKQDWYDTWQHSSESTEVQREVTALHNDGLARPPVASTITSQFSTSWMYQTVELTKRAAQRHWRDPTYLMAKLLLNVAGGLLIGFTFFKSKDTLQGTQNKLFAIFMATIVSVPLSNQLQVPFIDMRTIYEVRERPSRIYSWTSMLASLIITELPWDILGSSLFFICWYWTVGFENGRAGYTYLLMGVTLPFYYTTIGLAVAAMSPTAQIAGLLFSLLFSFVLTFNGVLQPFAQLGWWQWMYRLSPYTYLIEGLLGQAIGKQNITCSTTELVTLNPPSGQTCGSYMEAYISAAGGYLTNSEATSSCHFCSSRTTDEFLGKAFNIEYSHHWRNFGLMFAFILFNTVCIFIFTYLFRIRTGSLLGSIKKRMNRKTVA